MPSPAKRNMLLRIGVVPWLTGLMLAVGGCGGSDHAGDSAARPTPVMNIDPQYQMKPASGGTYNSFNEGSVYDEYRSLELVCKLFRKVEVTTNYVVPKSFIFDPDSIMGTPDYEEIWSAGHWADSARREDFPYFLFSAKRHMHISSTPGDSIAGLCRHPGPCSPGTWTSFDSSSVEFSMVFYNPVYAIEQSLINAGVDRDLAKREWGCAMAHELGHLYACLPEFTPAQHNQDNFCIMRYLVGETDSINEWLHYPAFCDSCKSHIENVGSCSTCARYP